MRVCLALLLLACPVWSEPPSEELLLLDATLSLRQNALRQGELSTDDYRTFVAQFQPVLGRIAAGVPQTRENQALHQDILRRLQNPGGSDASAPGTATPLSEARAAFDRGDYAAALASAEDVLGRDPTNQAALALKQLSAGRSRTVAPSIQAPASSSFGAEPVPNRPNSSDAANLPRVPGLKFKPASGKIEQYNSFGDSEAEPPTLWERAVSLATPDEPTISEDLRVLQRNIQEFELPPDVQSVGPTDDAALSNFLHWVKNVRREDLPPIDYTVIDPRLFGFYQMSALTKGSVSMSHRIRAAEAEARSVVLLHELYHYWDKKVAHLHYENVSYGMIGEGSEPQHEYNAYQLAVLYWQRFKPEGAASQVARALNQFPTDPEELRRRVDAISREERR